VDRGPLGPAAVAPSATARLLEIPMHRIGVASLRFVRVLPELLSRPTLPKQVPAAIELDFDGPQPLLIGIELRVVLAVARFASLKLVLFCDEAFYPRRDALIAHRLILVRAARRRPVAGRASRPS
jgi:hypothetical protein